MRAIGYGFNTITARAGIPTPKTTSSGRTLTDDLARLAKRKAQPSGFDWAAAEAKQPKVELVAEADAPRRPKGGYTPAQRKVATKAIAGSPSAAQVDAMVTMYEATGSLREVAEHFGYSRATVTRWLRSRDVLIKSCGGRTNYVRPDPAPKYCEAPECTDVVPYDPQVRIDQYKAKKTCSEKCAKALSAHKKRLRLEAKRSAA